MAKQYYRDYTTLTFPCEFLHGTLRAYQVVINDRQFFLSRKHSTKLENAIRVPLWLAKKAGLTK